MVDVELAASEESVEEVWSLTSDPDFTLGIVRLAQRLDELKQRIKGLEDALDERDLEHKEEMTYYDP